MTCSYTDAYDSLFENSYTIDPFCWLYPIPGDKITTTDRGIVVAASTNYCLCPYCYQGADALCYTSRPSGTECPDGWVCTVTTTGSSVAYSVPTDSGIQPYDSPYRCDVTTITATSGTSTFVSTSTLTTSSTSEWDVMRYCNIEQTSGSSHTGMTWTATLDSTTIPIPGGSEVLRSWKWKCIGPLCNNSCGNPLVLAADALKCIFSLLTHCKKCFGIGGWPFPPPVWDQKLKWHSLRY